MATLFSPEFLALFLVFFVCYWLVAPWVRLQNSLLLLAGYYFVGHSSVEALMVLVSWSLCVCLLVQIAASRRYKDKTVPLLITLLVSYFMAFKYLMPLNDWLQMWLAGYQIDLPLSVINLMLPLGMSFYLFNSVSLVIPVRNGELPPPDILTTLLYINFIPTLIAGPVNRAIMLIPQLAAEKRQVLEYQRAIFLIVLALIKLFLLSSWLNEQFVATAYASPAGQNGWELVIATYAWAWNIYFNFSGYTNLVTGIALLLGFRIGRNFSHPYQADSLKVFWHDWHISLSTFIRDYIYLPLGGNRKGYARTQLNVLMAMILSGIWHGAGINFFLWGLIHGLGLVSCNLWQRFISTPLRFRLPTVVARLLTFHFVCFAWIFFKAATPADALQILDNIIHAQPGLLTAQQIWLLLGFVLVIVIYPEVVRLRIRAAAALSTLRWYALPLVIVPLLALAFFFAPSGVPGFIYANF